MSFSCAQCDAVRRSASLRKLIFLHLTCNSAVLKMRLLSIDIGIKNLGLVSIALKPKWRVLSMKLVDITDVQHNVVPHSKCTLRHTNELSDRLAHVVQDNPDMFEGQSVILAERQPIRGLTGVEQYFYNRYLHCELVHPRSVIAFYRHPTDYDKRKERSALIAYQILREYGAESCAIKAFDAVDRKHDLADAINQAWFWACCNGFIKIDHFESDAKIIWYKPSFIDAKLEAAELVRRALGEEIVTSEPMRELPVLSSIAELDKYRYVPKDDM